MIFLILLLGLALRLINLNQSLWLDEAITALAVKNNSLFQIITNFSPGDFHPPLYYLVLKLWSNIFGYSEIALRAPSILFGLITIYFVYLIGKKHGLIAALLLAVNPLAIYYSQEARMYSMAMMFVAGSIYFLREKKWFWFIIFATASLYTDYLPFLMLPVYLILAENKRVIFLQLLLFFPWLPYFFSQLQNGITVSASSWGDLLGRTNFKNLALVPIKFIFGRITVPNNLVYLFSIGYLIGILKNKDKIAWLWLTLPLIIAAVISIKIPVFTYFRFLFVLPAFILLIAHAPKYLLTLFLIVSIASLSFFNLNKNFWREDWRGTANYINSDPGRVDMPNMAQSAPLIYYKAILTYKDGPVYLIRYVQEIFDPQDIKRTILETQGYKRVEVKNFSSVVVWKYQ